jgi:hypothetical protein
MQYLSVNKMQHLVSRENHQGVFFLEKLAEFYGDKKIKRRPTVVRHRLCSSTIRLQLAGEGQ